MDHNINTAELLDRFRGCSLTICNIGSPADHWENLEDNPEGQHRLVNLIGERAYTDEGKIVATTLKSPYHIVVGHNANGPTEHTVDPSLY